MKRWEAFNKHYEAAIPESMERQALKIFTFKIVDAAGFDVMEKHIAGSLTDLLDSIDAEALFNAICDWLNEEVEEGKHDGRQGK